MKNIGSERIALADIQRSDVFCGAVGNFDHLSYTSGIPGDKQWTEEFGPGYDLNANSFWDPGETLKITAKTSFLLQETRSFSSLHFPNGIWRSMNLRRADKQWPLRE